MKDELFTQKDRNHWLIMGKYYGYPECCINSFTKRDVFDPLTKEQEAVHKNKGFIPCPKCAKKVHNGSVSIEGLIKDRLCPEPYPNEGRTDNKAAYLRHVLTQDQPF